MLSLCCAVFASIHALLTKPDPRSLRLNFEIALEVYDAATCRQLAQYIIAARDRSKVLTAATLNAVGNWERARNSLFWLLSPYL